MAFTFEGGGNKKRMPSCDDFCDNAKRTCEYLVEIVKKSPEEVQTMGKAKIIIIYYKFNIEQFC